ncbi:hypothetical protein LEP1GSC047_1436 [Leptospira inadai serovar Lyme str. 10]|uniref:Uncharacterized protein n=2 Tax=Leptospira inadai serovar Lyme TaxID=293084 RepID=V6HSP3_9LEPT|nr:hypothetical protein [Leptospira inadai]EQA35644.1 hypothetical protein LEP1GSC047_1436 [Leptospira inadai serovar Lyme str. 10]PNV75323.1 hypothetical protein BES34_008680 [Leptospira inadai serovar Lyme]
MNRQEIIELNSLLAEETSARNSEHSIFVDNLHTPYLEFEQNFVLPSCSVFEVDFPAARAFLEVAKNLVPELVSNCLVLPEPRPKRDSDRLFLVKPFYPDDQIFRENSPKYWEKHLPPYLLVLSFQLMYLGGADKIDIVTPAVQGRTMSVNTKRIYYFARVVPLDYLVVDDGLTVDFFPRKYSESEFMVQVGTEHHDSFRHTYSEIFDEVDYSRQIKIITETLGVTSKDWLLGRIFEPLAVEYLTLTARFLESSSSKIARDFISFRQVVDLLLTPDNMTLEESARESLYAWLRSYTSERIVSPSGNMAWKILREERT